ncbi:MAG TPA: phosphoglycerate mutase family protein [Steroidobacteraceae bacterium]
MEPPAITRHRRPFLAPIWLSAATFILLAVILFAAYRTAPTTTVILVRHAEKQLGSIEDPPLTPEGERRAERLAQMFGSLGGAGRLDAIYVSDTRRAQQTASALAERLGLKPVVVPGGDVDAIARRVIRENRGGVVLVVGHSNTVPQIIHKLTGYEVPEIPDEEHDNLYVVSVPSFGGASLVWMKY